MVPDARPNASPSALTHALAATLCLLAPVEAFLAQNHYSALAPEALPVQLAPLVPGLLVGALARFGLVKLACLALWACVLVAVGFLQGPSTIRGVLLLVLASGVAFWVLRRHAATVLAFAAATHIVATLALPQAGRAVRVPTLGPTPPQASASDLPPVVHLVMDEFAGPRGMPGEVPGVGPVVTRLAEGFLAHGFEVHTHAYSQYTDSTDSLSHLFNFSSGGQRDAFVTGSGERYVLRANKYFEHLTALGYTLRIYQSTYVRFCASPNVRVASCQIYLPNSIEAIADAPIPASEKARFIANSFLDSSAFLGKVRYAYFRAGEKLGIELPAWPSGNSRVGPLASLPVIARLKSALRELRPGEAYFAHLMLPHYPYNLDADCRVKPQISTWLNTMPFERTGRAGQRNDTASRADRYRQYAAQVDCTRVLLDEMFAAIRASGQWERAVVIVHGDHGSRIARRFPYIVDVDHMVDDDYRDAYATFFAARRGAAPGRLETSVLPLQTLLGAFWQLPAPRPEPHQVYAVPAGDGDLRPMPLRGLDPL